MTTIADRILAISGQASGTVGALAAAFPSSSGDTIAERFTSYSGLATGTVAQHLNTEPQPVEGGASGFVRDTSRDAIDQANRDLLAFAVVFTATVS